MGRSPSQRSPRHQEARAVIESGSECGSPAAEIPQHLAVEGALGTDSVEVDLEGGDARPSGLFQDRCYCLLMLEGDLVRLDADHRDQIDAVRHVEGLEAGPDQNQAVAQVEGCGEVGDANLTRVEEAEVLGALPGPQNRSRGARHPATLDDHGCRQEA
jgi:hypothetical protein